jgi:hypothetical protein
LERRSDETYPNRSKPWSAARHGPARRGRQQWRPFATQKLAYFGACYFELQGDDAYSLPLISDKLLSQPPGLVFDRHALVHVSDLGELALDIPQIAVYSFGVDSTTQSIIE